MPSRAFSSKELWHASVWPLVVVSVAAAGFRSAFVGAGLLGAMAGAYLARRFAKNPVFTLTAAFRQAIVPLVLFLTFWTGLTGIGSIFAFLPDLLGLTPAAHWAAVALRLLVHTVVMAPLLAATWAWFVVKKARALDAAEHTSSIEPTHASP